MGTEVLSQAEVENLLNAMATSGEAGSPAGAPADVGAVHAPARGREKITPYDFKRPERVGKEQMRALQTLHEGFGRNFGAALSGLLRSIVEVKLTSVDQLTYSEFVFSLENPTCFNLLKAEPLEGNLILDINPSILFPIIDRLLGGGREGGPLARRPLTDIELRLVSRITGLFLEELRHAWENVLEMKLEVVQIESNPQLVQIVPPNEVVVVISFELTIGDLRGMMNLCIPYNSIERIGGQLSANSWVAYGRRQATPETIQQISRTVCTSLVELNVRLAASRIGTAELIGLRVGDVITTAKDVHTPVVVSVEGIPKFRARPGAFKGHKAVLIDGVIENPAEALGQ
jgi:flagellar motor switch protein FliM